MSLRERALNWGRNPAFGGRSTLRQALSELRIRVAHPLGEEEKIVRSVRTELPHGSGMTEFNQAFSKHALKGGDIMEYEVPARDGKNQKKKGIFAYPYPIDPRDSTKGIGICLFPTDYQPTLRHEETIGDWKIVGSIPEKIYDALFWEAVVDKASPLILDSRPTS